MAPERRDRVEEKSGLEMRGRELPRENIFPPRPQFFFLIEANSANQNAEY